MARKQLIWIGLFVGSFVGGAVPMLWGASAFSLSSVITTALGSIAGIWLGFKLGE